MKKILITILMFGIGGSAMAQKLDKVSTKIDNSKISKEERFQKRLIKMEKDLNLSREQVEKLKSIYDFKNSKVELNSQDAQGDKDQIQHMRKERQEKIKNELKAILTPDQFKKWQTMRKDKRSHFNKEFKSRKEIVNKSL